MKHPRVESLHAKDVKKAMLCCTVDWLQCWVENMLAKNYRSLATRSRTLARALITMKSTLLETNEDN